MAILEIRQVETTIHKIINLQNKMNIFIFYYIFLKFLILHKIHIPCIKFMLKNAEK